VKQVLSEIKRKAKTSDKAASEIVKEISVHSLPACRQGSLPQLKNVKKNIRRARAAVEGNLVITYRRENDLN
jgi:hypothetical protein